MAKRKTKAVEIKEELLEVLDTEQKRSESEQDYRKRLVRLVAELEDDDWDSLSEEAQEWFNAGAARMNDGQTVADFDGSVEEPKEEEEEEEKPKKRRGRRASTPKEEKPEEEEEEPEEEDEEEPEEEEKPKRRGRRAAPKKEEEEKPKRRGRRSSKKDEEEEETEEEEEEEAPKKRGRRSSKKDEPKKVPATKRVTQLVCEDATISIEDVLETLDEEGYTISESVARGTYRDANRIIDILEEAGRLK